MKILFVDKVHTFLSERLTKHGHKCVNAFLQSKEEIEKNINSYDGLIIRSRFKIDDSFLKKAVNLKFIARAGSGLENIDVKYAKSKNIYCINAPEGNKQAVAEHTIGLILSLFNNIIKSSEEIQNNIWLREENRGIELQGKTVGIIGFGNTGSALASLLSSFNLKILAYDKFLNKHKFRSSIKQIYEDADIISLHIPYNEENKYFINAKFITNFKKSIYLINTSRGLCVNTNDVVSGMKNGKIKGVCMDVLEYETSCFKNLKLEKIAAKNLQYLNNSQNAILTPHIAGLTKEGELKISQVLLKKILQLDFCN